MLQLPCEPAIIWDFWAIGISVCFLNRDDGVFFHLEFSSICLRGGKGRFISVSLCLQNKPYNGCFLCRKWSCQFCILLRGRQVELQLRACFLHLLVSNSIPTIYVHVHPPILTISWKFKTRRDNPPLLFLIEITSQDWSIWYQNSPGMYQFLLIKRC